VQFSIKKRAFKAATWLADTMTVVMAEVVVDMVEEEVTGTKTTVSVVPALFQRSPLSQLTWATSPMVLSRVMFNLCLKN